MKMIRYWRRSAAKRKATEIQAANNYSYTRVVRRGLKWGIDVWVRTPGYFQDEKIYHWAEAHWKE